MYKRTFMGNGKMERDVIGELSAMTTERNYWKAKAAERLGGYAVGLRGPVEGERESRDWAGEIAAKQQELHTLYQKVIELQQRLDIALAQLAAKPRKTLGTALADPRD